MGAYYETQISEIEEQQEQLLLSISPYFFKFLESFYCLNPVAIDTINYIVKKTNKEKQVVVRTACDYDEEGVGAVGKVFEWGDEKYTTKANALNNNYNGGWVVCEDAGTAINLDEIEIIHCLAKKEKKWLVSPIAILTRKNRERMGGGDADFSEVELASSWYAKKVFWQQEKPSQKDITQDVLFYESEQGEMEKFSVPDYEKQYSNNDVREIGIFESYSETPEHFKGFKWMGLKDEDIVDIWNFGEYLDCGNISESINPIDGYCFQAIGRLELAQMVANGNFDKDDNYISFGDNAIYTYSDLFESPLSPFNLTDFLTFIDENLEEVAERVGRESFIHDFRVYFVKNLFKVKIVSKDGDISYISGTPAQIKEALHTNSMVSVGNMKELMIELNKSKSHDYFAFCDNDALFED